MEPIVGQNQTGVNTPVHQNVATDTDNTNAHRERGVVSTTLKRDKVSKKARSKKVQENLNLQVTGEYALPQLNLLAYKKRDSK
jgi:hypothetical protein